MTSRYGLQIRAATMDDGTAIAELFTSAGHPIPPSRIKRRLDAIHGGSGTVLLALEWGPLSGLVALDWAMTFDDDLPVARITTLLVAQADRRRGIGRLLLKAASQAARAAGCGTLSLALPDQASELESFADASGFEPTGRLALRSLRRRG
jgi:aminoglycoside 6'-N-acetyltransferase I